MRGASALAHCWFGLAMVAVPLGCVAGPFAGGSSRPGSVSGAHDRQCGIGRHLLPSPGVEREEVHVHEEVARGAQPAVAAQDEHLVAGLRELVLRLLHDGRGRVVAAERKGRGVAEGGVEGGVEG
eukprot:scaffold124635_cov33-Phaeocystis_antarctica.AAC.1